MLAYKIRSDQLINNIFIPKYYDPDLYQEIHKLEDTHELLQIGKLIDDGVLIAQTGHEIGKMAYGTGNIPFVRTSDISNWEIKTIPKQGISEEIYSQYAEKEDVRPGDILMVRDGTYLIGTNCMISEMDIPMVYQSHILKFRINDEEELDPYLFFLALNCSLVQRQIRNMQFTADIIDTLGGRYREIILPIPKDDSIKNSLKDQLVSAFERRIKYKAAIKQMPLLIESVLDTDSLDTFDDFFGKSIDEILDELVQDTTTLEFGSFSAFKMSSEDVVNNIFLPKYYDPEIHDVLESLNKTCDLVSIKQMVDDGIVELNTGDEIGKMAYGTGTIPFVRTSDFSNWEIKTDAKQGVSEEIYKEYASKEDVRPEDILLVRDGTYLVGTSSMITDSDAKMLYCGGLIKIRCCKTNDLNPYLLLGLLNSYIVKRQIRTKQFTRDVIDTLGRRFEEVVLPVPKSKDTREKIEEVVKAVVNNRIKARDEMLSLASLIIA